MMQSLQERWAKRRFKFIAALHAHRIGMHAEGQAHSYLPVQTLQTDLPVLPAPDLGSTFLLSILVG